MNEPELLTFSNDGQRLVSTNYWNSKYAAKNLLFLSFNAGAARLLIPKGMEPMLKELKTGSYCIISRGKLKAFMLGQKRIEPEKQGVDMYELLFEDFSDAPYCVHVEVSQSDRTLPEVDSETDFILTAWTEAGLQFTLPAKYRKVDYVPCLKPWKNDKKKI